MRFPLRRNSSVAENGGDILRCVSLWPANVPILQSAPAVILTRAAPVAIRRSRIITILIMVKR